MEHVANYIVNGVQFITVKQGLFRKTKTYFRADSEHYWRDAIHGYIPDGYRQSVLSMLLTIHSASAGKGEGE